MKTTPASAPDKTSTATHSSQKHDASVGQVNKQSSLAVAQAKVDHQLTLSIQHQLTQLPNPLTMPIAKGLKEQLHNQTVALMLDGHRVQVFLQSQLLNQSLALSPALAQAFRQWLLKDAKLDFKLLPQALQEFLSQALSGGFRAEQHTLAKLQLNQQLLSISWFNRAPITEVSLLPKSQATEDTLQQLLQMVLPIELNDKATLVVRERPSSTRPSSIQNAGICFDMAFDLTPLGKLDVEVQLHSFHLVTSLKCSNLKLQQTVEKHWPKLLNRLNNLGFQCQFKFELTPELTSSSRHTHSGLVNIKV